MSSRRFEIVAVAALLLSIFAVYWPGLSGGFLFDDFPNIVSNARVHLEHLDLQSLRNAAGAYELGDFGRPLATLSFGLNYYFGGKDPWGFKFVGVAVHVLNALLVFVLVSMIWDAKGEPTRSRAAPLVITAAWALHPLQVSTVLYVVQRMEMLSLTFVLGALIAYIQGRRRQLAGRSGGVWIFAAGGLAAVGLLAKETAALFPAYAFALELTLFGFAARSTGLSRAIRWSYGAGIAVGAAVFVAWAIPHYGSAANFALRDFTAYERVLTQLRVLVLYLAQIMVPAPSALRFYYDTFPASTGWLQPMSTLASGIALAMLFTSAVVLRRRGPIYALGILWFFAAHLITSNILPLELVFEHRNYFALLGIALAAADLTAGIPMAHGPALKRLAVGTAIVFLAFLTFLRASSWGSPLQLALELVARDPMSARARSDLATMYFSMADGSPQSPFYSMAQEEFSRAASLPSASALPLQGLILMSAAADQPVSDRLWGQLRDKLAHSRIGPNEMAAVSGLLENRAQGVALDDRQLALAYRTLAARATLPAAMYAQMAVHSIEQLHDEDAAGAYFGKAISASPRDRAFARRIYAELVVAGHVRAADQVLRAGQATSAFDGPAPAPAGPR